MKNSKRLLALSLAACMVMTTACAAKPAASSSKPESTAASASTATSTSTAAPAEVSFPLATTENFKFGTVIADGNPSNNEVKFWKDMEAETNVHIEWTETLLSAWPTKKSAIFTARDLPDAFMGRSTMTEEDIASYGAAGTFIQLQDLIDANMPNFSQYLEENPDVRKQITAPDGNIYSLPDIDATAYTADNVPYINQKWVAKVMPDLDLSKPMTLDVFKELLTKFKTEDPNGNGKADEIPWSVNLAGPNQLLRWSASFGISDTYNANLNTSHLYLDNGQVKYAPAEEGYKSFVKWLNELWTAGLLDTETFTQDVPVTNAKYKDPNRVVGYMYCWRNSAWSLSETDDEYVVTPPLDTGIAEPVWADAAPLTVFRDGLMITSACKNPELLLSWADRMYEPYTSLSINTAQMFGEHIEKNADGTIKQLRAIDWDREGEKALMPGAYTKLTIMRAEMLEKQDVKPPVYIQKRPIDEMMSAYYSDTMRYIPKVWLTAEDGKKVAIYRTDLDPYILDCFARWVTKGGIDEEWPEYLKKLESMGMKDLMAIYQPYCDNAAA